MTAHAAAHETPARQGDACHSAKHEVASPVLPGRSRFDRPLSDPAILLVIVLALMTVGILMVYSASRTACASGDGYYFTRHLIFVPVALGALVAGMFVPHRWLNRGWVALGVLGLAVSLLAAVLVVGIERNNARRWFELALGPLRLSFQPSEFAKFALVLFFAWFYGRKGADPRRFGRSFLPALGVIGLVCALVAKEDFGTAALVGLVAVVLCLIAGWRWWWPALLAAPAAAGFYATVMLVPFRLERIKVWLDPWKYADDAGWHICQSLMALGSGGLFGVGLGGGIQKLYIPENTTDFIFAVVCEEMGLMGGLLVIGLFGVFIWRAGQVVRGAPDRFAFLLASGILLVIGLQAVLNIGVVTSALPAKGISLPFISYGGSGLVMMSFAAGLLASVARRCVATEAAAAAPQPAADWAYPARPQPLVHVPAAEPAAGGAAPRAEIGQTDA